MQYFVYVEMVEETSTNVVEGAMELSSRTIYCSNCLKLQDKMIKQINFVTCSI